MNRDTNFVFLTKLLRNNAKMCIEPIFRYSESFVDFFYRDHTEKIYFSVGSQAILMSLKLLMLTGDSERKQRICQMP